MEKFLIETEQAACLTITKYYSYKMQVKTLQGY